MSVHLADNQKKKCPLKWTLKIKNKLIYSLKIVILIIDKTNNSIKINIAVSLNPSKKYKGIAIIMTPNAVPKNAQSTPHLIMDGMNAIRKSTAKAITKKAPSVEFASQAIQAPNPAVASKGVTATIFN